MNDDLERVCGLIEIFLWHFLRGTEDNHEEPWVRIAGILAEV